VVRIVLIHSNSICLVVRVKFIIVWIWKRSSSSECVCRVDRINFHHVLFFYGLALSFAAYNIYVAI